MKVPNAYAVGPPLPTHPDAVSALRNAIRRARTTLRIWHLRARTRRHLMALDNHLLADIGLSRFDAAREAAKPFWQE